MSEFKAEAARSELVRALQAARRVVVFTGAGISTDSGIPDYRGSGGQYSAYQPVYFQEFLGDDRKRREYWQHKASVWPAMRVARPGAGHRLVTRLHETGRLVGVITQNVDGLHEKSGLPPEIVINLHGSNLEVECIGCGRRVPAGEVLDDLVAVLSGVPEESVPGESVPAEGEPGTSPPEPSAPAKHDAPSGDNLALRLPTPEEVPICPTCEGFLKPATVMFGQNLNGEDLEQAERMLQNCDLLLAIGSTLMVQPAASIPLIAKRNGARLAIVTRGETPLDERADYRVDGDIASLAEQTVTVL